jgi:tetratricopeptide (TPR) repeat protein
MKEAIIDYTKAIELNPIIAKSAYNKIADLKYKFREYEDSIIYYSKVLNLSSNDSRPYYDRAWSYYLIDNLTDAISDITHAIRIEQTNRSYKEALSIFKKEKRKIKNWFN